MRSCLPNRGVNMKTILLITLFSLISFAQGPQPQPQVKIAEYNYADQGVERNVIIWFNGIEGKIQYLANDENEHWTGNFIVATIDPDRIILLKNLIAQIKDGQMIDMHPNDPLIPGGPLKYYYVYSSDKKIAIKSVAFGHSYVLQYRQPLIEGLVMLLDGFYFLARGYN